MNIQRWREVTCVLAIVFTITVLPSFAQKPEGVSPGALDRVVEIEGRCPSFSWGATPGAERYELVGYRIPEGTDPAQVDPFQAEQVLYTEVPGSATSWTPNLEQCLTPGSSFVWFVRAVLKEEDEVVEASEWSDGKYFSISSRPSVREVEEALSVLRRYSAQESESRTTEPQRLGTGEPRTQMPSFPSLDAMSVTTAKTAIRAGVPDASGENYGIVGLSNSPDGAGLAAANTNGGPDLVLDGSADNPADPDTVFTQAGIDRANSSDTSFSLLNSDPTGVLNLNVEGALFADSVTTTAEMTVGTHLDVLSGITVDGNTTLGDAGGDTITFNAVAGSYLDMNNHPILNIGVAGTDFTASGGLNLAGDLDVTGSITNLDLTDEFTVTHYNSAGYSEETMVSTSDSFCFLVLTSFTSIGDVGENATCYVKVSGGNWVLQAHFDSLGLGGAWCMARCFQW